MNSSPAGGPSEAAGSGSRRGSQRLSNLFLALILAQAAHSVEEYVFRLYDLFAPARFVSGLVGVDRALGFVVVNSLIVLFGFWCWLARVRPRHANARVYAGLWAVLETANGLGHLALALAARAYFPGLYTAPILLAMGAWLLVELRRSRRVSLFQ